MRWPPFRRSEHREAPPVPFVPPGHFYSPIVDPSEVAADADRIWPEHPAVHGIDWNDSAQRRVLTDVFPKHMPGYDYPEQLPDGPDLTDFYTRNNQFSWLDARALFVLMQEWRPARVIEVGSGYSSLLMADVNRRLLGGTTEIVCIEPYPPEYLRRGVDGITRLIEERVQHVPIDEFRRLEAGDILFIDSSHVSKTGSDVNHLFFEVLPALSEGVHLHFHDVFSPADYPSVWAVDENRSWNEQYLLQALLMYSHGFRVEFSSNYAQLHFPDLVSTALERPAGRGFGGGSIWLTKTV